MIKYKIKEYLKLKINEEKLNVVLNKFYLYINQHNSQQIKEYIGLCSEGNLNVLVLQLININFEELERFFYLYQNEKQFKYKQLISKLIAKDFLEYLYSKKLTKIKAVECFKEHFTQLVEAYSFYIKS